MQRMVKDATTAEQLGAILAYAKKVDDHNRTGITSHTMLDYEGPDLSPGADRPNSMGDARRKPAVRVMDAEGSTGGRKSVALINGDELEYA